MKPVYLCGFMGCGKSTVGKILARKNGCGFIDMDDYIVEREGMTIPQIFAEKGEKYFRDTETAVIGELAEKGAVIACGGGAMLKKENAEIASENGIVVYIDIPFEVCYGRISGDTNRPLVMNNTKEQLEEIYNGRAPVYRENSTTAVDGNGTAEEVAERIAEAIKY
ncbi:MAG: shikimate kinase [Oscillospiraceae bacterium]|nr:shikimate kinase [Oscillospiraceae bacterium]